MEHPEVELVRPPVPVRRSACRRGPIGCARDRALAFFARPSSRFLRSLGLFSWPLAWPEREEATTEGESYMGKILTLESYVKCEL